MWTVIWNSYLHSPWVGHGYFVSSASGQLKVWYTWTNWTAHNFWLQVLVGTGIIGAGLMAWSLGSYVLQLLRAGFIHRGYGRMACLAGTVLLWQCGWGLTNESFAGPLQGESIAFFTVLGLAIGRLGHANRNRYHSTQSKSVAKKATISTWQGTL
jgi:O-antigen ligase